MKVACFLKFEDGKGESALSKLIELQCLPSLETVFNFSIEVPSWKVTRIEWWSDGGSIDCEGAPSPVWLLEMQIADTPNPQTFEVEHLEWFHANGWEDQLV